MRIFLASSVQAFEALYQRSRNAKGIWKMIVSAQGASYLTELNQKRYGKIASAMVTTGVPQSATPTASGRPYSQKPGTGDFSQMSQSDFRKWVFQSLDHGKLTSADGLVALGVTLTISTQTTEATREGSETPTNFFETFEQGIRVANYYNDLDGELALRRILSLMQDEQNAM